MFSRVITPALANVEYPVSKHTTHAREARRLVIKSEGLFPQTGIVTKFGSCFGLVQVSTMRDTPFFHQLFSASEGRLG